MELAPPAFYWFHNLDLFGYTGNLDENLLLSYRFWHLGVCFLQGWEYLNRCNTANLCGRIMWAISQWCHSNHLLCLLDQGNVMAPNPWGYEGFILGLNVIVSGNDDPEPRLILKRVGRYLGLIFFGFVLGSGNLSFPLFC